MNKTAEDFIGSYLHIEVAYNGILGPTRDLIASMSPEYIQSLKDGFEELLANRDLSISDYDDLTHVEFEAEEDLYSYLQGVYDFLFNGAETAPEPPE